MGGKEARRKSRGMEGRSEGRGSDGRGMVAKLEAAGGYHCTICIVTMCHVISWPAVLTESEASGRIVPT